MKQWAKTFNIQAGDQVFASTFLVGFGGYAEYIYLPEDGIMAIKPTNRTFFEAAPLPIRGTTALRFLRKAKVQKDKKILIYGASGSVGFLCSATGQVIRCRSHRHMQHF